MKAQPAAFFRTALPFDLSALPAMDSGRYHSLWLPDHMVSFWPDALWTPEFTDLAETSPSPHRQLDSIAVSGTVAAMTQNVRIATSVIDTVRRHPALLAQSALTLSHLSKGRFILGLGSGETENIVPYGFDFSKPVSRFEEAVQVIRMLFESDGPLDFEGKFYNLHHALMDTEPYEGRTPEIWMGAGGPRMLDIVGRYADGWWPAAIFSPEDYAGKLKAVRDSADRAGRDPMAITTAFFFSCVIGDDEAELNELFNTPLIKAYHLLQITGAEMQAHGLEHPLGDGWRGYQDNDPAALTREVVTGLVNKMDADVIRSFVPHGTRAEIARKLKGYVEAGVRVYRIHDMSVLGGKERAIRAQQKIRDTEDELARLEEPVA